MGRRSVECAATGCTIRIPLTEEEPASVYDGVAKCADHLGAAGPDVPWSLGDLSAYCCGCGHHFRPRDVVAVENDWAGEEGVTMCRPCAERGRETILHEGPAG